MPNKENYTCRVCGLEQATPPWGVDGILPSFEICDCCGVEFGYEDSTISGIRNYRSEWLEKGHEWVEKKSLPRHWDLEEQLKNIPLQYR